MSELKPCPFCGGNAEYIEDDGNHHYAECKDCGTSRGGFAYTPTEFRTLGIEGIRERTSEAWNTRAAPNVKALKWTPWPDNKVDYLYQNCKTDNPFFDGHIILKGEIYELHIGDEYHNSYLSLEEAKDAAQAFFNDEILDQIEV